MIAGLSHSAPSSILYTHYSIRREGTLTGTFLAFGIARPQERSFGQLFAGATVGHDKRSMSAERRARARSLVRTC
eukprot:9488946-Pyramimonas_sp.AAC.2